MCRSCRAGGRPGLPQKDGLQRQAGSGGRRVAGHLYKSWLFILFECGVEIRGIDRYHLLCTSPHPDGRQMDESADMSPRKPRGAVDRFLIMIDAIVAGRLHRIEVRQPEWCGEVNDGLCGTAGHGYDFRRSTHRRLPHCSHPNRNDADAASTSVVSAGVHSRVQTERPQRRMA